MKTLNEILKNYIINPNNIIIKNKKGINIKYSLYSRIYPQYGMSGIEILVIDIKNCNTNINIGNVIIRKENIDNYPILKLINEIIFKCNEDANKEIKNSNKEEFEDEFETDAMLDAYDDFYICGFHYFGDYCKKYFNMNVKKNIRLKLYCKKGKIVIEKIGE